MKYTVAAVTTTCRNVTPAQTQLQFSRYEQEESSEHQRDMVTVRLPSKVVFGIGSEGIYHTSSTWLAGSGVGPCLGKFMLWTPEFIILLYHLEKWKCYPSTCLLEWDRDRHTDKQTAPLTSAGGHTPVVVVVETICYVLLEVHIGELEGLCSIQDSKLKLTGGVKLQNPSPFLSFPG